jgi:hypothetical protein
MHKQVKVWFLITMIIIEVVAGVYAYFDGGLSLSGFTTLSLVLFLFVGVLFTSLIYYPIVVNSISKNIQSELGKYTTITNLNGFEHTFSTGGQKLILTDDNKLYRVTIEATAVTKITQVDSRVLAQ